MVLHGVSTRQRGPLKPPFPVYKRYHREHTGERQSDTERGIRNVVIEPKMRFIKYKLNLTNVTASLDSGKLYSYMKH